ncbi:MAG TPA: hypothetical protein ENN05_04705 [Deltaproteobacteria bacterium]|nr:hypothetical protein [Deltaproteobacteria bacterium]
MREDLLEFSALKEHIQNFVASDAGMSALEGLGPFRSWDEAKRRWEMLEEMMDVMSSSEPLVISAIPDIHEMLGIHEGAILEGQDIITISHVLKSSARLKHAVEKTGVYLARISAGIDPLEDLSTEIDAMLDPTGEISETASPLLREMRTQYKSARTSVLAKLEGIIDSLRTKSVLMDDIITKRNDRYVICMRHDHPGQMKGITHDYSRTNKTAYVEPLSIIDENNELNQLKADIVEEENRILKGLTLLILSSAGLILNNLRIYGMLDLLRACAVWAIKNHAVIPRLGTEGINLMGARHPLLLERLGDLTVPLDIKMPEGKDTLIITGPNAGGKTVALKTLGLLISMAKSGLAIPVKPDSLIAPVGNIWVEMDTNQDIQHDLSSFTAHALALKHIYENVTQGDLVLLDEPGSGTDPQQGGAIAVSCIDALRKKGACVVATSHSDLIKLYGMSCPGVENAATAFDDTGMKPLFHLQYGVIGQSRAFEILESIDFPGNIIKEASAVVSRDAGSALSRAMEDISHAGEMRRQAACEMEQAALLKEKAGIELKEIEQIKIRNAMKYKRLIDKVEALANRPKAKDSAKEVKEVRSSEIALELEQIFKESDPGETLSIHKGSSVRFKGTETTGEVLQMYHDTVDVLFGDKRMKVGLEQIEGIKPSAGKPTRKKMLRVSASQQIVLPIKVVGMRVDEALPVVEKAIDQAVLSGQPSLEIIHGTGTGALKKAIRVYLKGLPHVKVISDGSVGEGGGNKTIAVFDVR